MEVGVAKAKDSFSELIDRAEAGEVVTITRHGRAVATLSPAQAHPTRAEMDTWLADLKARRSEMPTLTSEEIVAAVHEGRRY